MNDMKILNREFIKEWKGDQLRNLSLMYPEISREDLEALVDEQIMERCVDAKASLHNNYENRYFETSLLHVIDWIKQTNPIMAGFGTFFKNQHQARNPSAKMLDKFLIQRKKYKSQLKKYNPLDREYAKFDNYQKSEKICANSWLVSPQF